MSKPQIGLIPKKRGYGSSLSCPACQSVKVTSMGQYGRHYGKFFTWWKCTECKHLYNRSEGV